MMAQKCAVIAQNVLFFGQKWTKNSTNVLPQHISFNSDIYIYIAMCNAVVTISI